MRAGIAVLALTFLACGGASVEPVTVRTAVYDTEFETVWNAVIAEMRDRFHDEGIKVEDVASGVIVSNWKVVTPPVSQQPIPQAIRARGFFVGNQEVSATGDLIQLGVRIGPGPPWHVFVDGQGAHRLDGSPLLAPYPRGTDDTPLWVQRNIDAAQAGIHERLQKYAVSVPADATPR